jgi:hypothetical protein
MVARNLMRSCPLEILMTERSREFTLERPAISGALLINNSSEGKVKVTHMKLQQNVDSRIDHIVWLVRSDNFEPTIALFQNLLAVEFDGVWEAPELGLRIGICWEAGVEVLTTIAPDDPRNMYTKRLMERGEGLDAVVFGVDSLPNALGRANSIGFETGKSYAPASQKPWLSRFRHFEEAVVGELLGVRLVFGHIDPKP